jgi:hypothetical protein
MVGVVQGWSRGGPGGFARTWTTETIGSYVVSDGGPGGPGEIAFFTLHGGCKLHAHTRVCAHLFTPVSACKTYFAWTTWTTPSNYVRSRYLAGPGELKTTWTTPGPPRTTPGPPDSIERDVPAARTVGTALTLGFLQVVDPCKVGQPVPKFPFREIVVVRCVVLPKGSPEGFFLVLSS